MAKERGWWKLETTVEIDNTDREHIARAIEEGCTESEICDTSDEEEE